MSSASDGGDPRVIYPAMPCRLKVVPDSSLFEGPTGQEITLVVKDRLGTVLISKAEYGGGSLVPAGQTVSRLTFTLAPDRNTLKLVLVFSASTGGRGELREEAGSDSQFLRDLAGDEPFQALRIMGK
jgi:hypothetical protein